MISEFQINYTACADLSREISSQMKYIESIQKRMMKCKENIDMLNEDAKKRCNSDSIVKNIFHLNNYFNFEKNRYSNLKTQFEAFYHYVEETEISMANSLETRYHILSQKKNDEVFLKAHIEWFQMENSFTYTENALIENGLSSQEAHELMALLTSEGQERIKSLASCSQEELEREKKKLSQDHSSDLLNKMLKKILQQKEPRKLLSQLSKCLADNNFSGYIEEALLGVGKETLINFQLRFQNMDINSFAVNEDVMSAMKIEEFLKTGVSLERQTCYQLFQKASHSIQTVNNAISKVYKVVDFENKAKQYYDDYEYYGADAFEASYGFVFDKVSSIAGNAIGKWADGTIGVGLGVKLGGIVGTVGGPLGTVAGVVLGGVIGAASSVLINEVGKMTYNQVVEPARNWWKDTCNDIEDWWDMLWW